MAAFSLRELLALCLLCFFALTPSAVVAAPARVHSWHAKRSVFDFKWAGHVFGGDRWGVVMGPPAPKEDLAIDPSSSGQDPLNPAVKYGLVPACKSLHC